MNFANKHGKHNLRGNGVYDMLVNAYTAHADRFIETKRKLDRCIRNNETLPPRIMKRWKSMLKRAKDQGCKVVNADRSRGTASVEYKHQKFGFTQTTEIINVHKQARRIEDALKRRRSLDVILRCFIRFNDIRKYAVNKRSVFNMPYMPAQLSLASS